MNNTEVGMLAIVLVASALIAWVGASVALSRYRRAVLRSMNEAAGVAEPVRTAASRPPKHRLDIALLPRGTSPVPLHGPGRAAQAYVHAALGYAATMSLAAHASQDFGWLGLAYLGWIYAWPVVPTVALVSALGRGQALRALAVYAGVGAVLMGLALSMSTSSSAPDLIGAWFRINGLPTLVVGAFLQRRIRAAGPLMLAIAVPAVLGSLLALSALASDEATRRSVAAFGEALGMGAASLLGTTMALGALVFGAAAWLGLRWLGACYERRAFSDETLTLGALWLAFAFTHSLLLATEHLAWLLAGPLAFAVWWLLARRGLALLPHTDCPRTLVLLRVFALGSRGAKLFELLRRRWLRGGPIMMIAGPDLATSAVEPHEFLNFLGGKLDRQFVDSAGDMVERIALMPEGPDPDARYRVHEFFCRADTWQSALQRLLPLSDAVLMDLRGFGPDRCGCVYEIGRVLDTVPLTKVVFTVDDTTDRSFLQSVIDESWAALARDSPNRATARPAVRLFDLRGPDAAELEALVGHLGGTMMPPTDCQEDERTRQRA